MDDPPFSLTVDAVNTWALRIGVTDHVFYCGVGPNGTNCAILEFPTPSFFSPPKTVTLFGMVFKVSFFRTLPDSYVKIPYYGPSPISEPEEALFKVFTAQPCHLPDEVEQAIVTALGHSPTPAQEAEPSPSLDAIPLPVATSSSTSTSVTTTLTATPTSTAASVFSPTTVASVSSTVTSKWTVTPSSTNTVTFTAPPTATRTPDGIPPLTATVMTSPLAVPSTSP